MDDLILLVLVKVDAAGYYLVPLFAIDGFDLGGYFLELVLELFHSSIDIAFFGLSDYSKDMLFFDYFWVIPKLWWPCHLNFMISVALLFHLVHD